MHGLTEACAGIAATVTHRLWDAGQNVKVSKTLSIQFNVMRAAAHKKVLQSMEQLLHAHGLAWLSLGSALQYTHCWDALVNRTGCLWERLAGCDAHIAGSQAVTQSPGTDLLGSNSEQGADHKPAVHKPKGFCSGRHGKGCCIQQQALGGPRVPPSCGTSAHRRGTQTSLTEHANAACRGRVRAAKRTRLRARLPQQAPASLAGSPQTPAQAPFHKPYYVSWSYQEGQPDKRKSAEELVCAPLE